MPSKVQRWLVVDSMYKSRLTLVEMGREIKEREREREREREKRKRGGRKK